jgi:hypothetical protein
MRYHYATSSGVEFRAVIRVFKCRKTLEISQKNKEKQREKNCEKKLPGTEVTR